MLNDATVEEFKASLRGELIQRSDERYEEARKLYNGMIDKRPLLIARCADVADVICAVRFGRENDLLTAIRGGGHNGPGLGSCNDGLVIDLSLMKGVRVDPANRTVRVGPGCTQGDVDHATHAFGLAVPAGIVSTTGIGGLTLGGGHGYLSRKYGLTIDNLIEADVVLADGRLVTASATQHEDLFWALRGGGGNFGVVTSFLYQSPSRQHSLRGTDLLGSEGRTEGDEVVPGVPAPGAGGTCSRSCIWGLCPRWIHFPRNIWGKKNCALVSCYSGPLEKAEEAIRPIRRELPPPILDWMGPDAFPRPAEPVRSSAAQGSAVVLERRLRQGAFRSRPSIVHLEHALQFPSELSLMHLYPIDGAVHEVGPSETAWNCRDATWSMVIAGIDPDPAKAAALKAWAKGYWEAVHPYNLGGAYVNFMMEEGEDRIRATYGDNYDRLVAIKKKYDPTNFFRVNQNIKPAP